MKASIKKFFGWRDLSLWGEPIEISILFLPNLSEKTTLEWDLEEFEEYDIFERGIIKKMFN